MISIILSGLKDVGNSLLKEEEYMTEKRWRQEWNASSTKTILQRKNLSLLFVWKRCDGDV